MGQDVPILSGTEAPGAWGRTYRYCLGLRPLGHEEVPILSGTEAPGAWGRTYRYCLGLRPLGHGAGRSTDIVWDL